MKLAQNQQIILYDQLQTFSAALDVLKMYFDFKITVLTQRSFEKGPAHVFSGLGR